MRYMRLLGCLLGLACLWSSAWAQRYPLPAVGESRLDDWQIIYSEPHDTLEKIAKRYQVKLVALEHLNPDLKHHPKPWTRIKIPGITLPSSAPREGIVINLAENKLFFFPPQGHEVWVFPIADGRAGWETPLGQTKIIGKQKDPIWHVPESIQLHMEMKGQFIPDKIGPGPNNPLGRFALRTGLDQGRILIHGTNAPSSIGNDASSGCIRMFNEDIETLFGSVGVGTAVRVIDEPQSLTTRIEKQLASTLSIVAPPTPATHQQSKTLIQQLAAGQSRQAPLLHQP